MPVGITATLTKTQVDNQLGSIADQLDYALTRVQQAQTWLTAQTNAAMNSYGYATQADIDLLKSAFSDLDQLRQIYQGLAALASAKDFRAFAKQINGTGVH